MYCRTIRQWQPAFAMKNGTVWGPKKTPGLLALFCGGVDSFYLSVFSKKNLRRGVHTRCEDGPLLGAASRSDFPLRARRSLGRGGGDISGHAVLLGRIVCAAQRGRIPPVPVGPSPTPIDTV